MPAIFREFEGVALVGAIVKRPRLFNCAHFTYRGASVRKLGCAAQKRGFACAVIYLEYPHIYRHLSLSEIGYKHSLFGRFQIKKSIGRYLPMDSYFYVECPKNGMLITAFVHAERRNKSIRSESLSRPSAVQSR